MQEEEKVATYQPGDVVAYVKGDGTFELGVVKRDEPGRAFVAYHCGDTVAATPHCKLLRCTNQTAVEGLIQRMHQLGRETWPLSEGCEDWSNC